MNPSKTPIPYVQFTTLDIFRGTEKKYEEWSNFEICASRFSAVVAELLISQHAPCNKLLFLVQKFHFRLIPKNYREYHWYSCKKAGISRKSFSTRIGRSAVAIHRGPRGLPLPRSFMILGGLKAPFVPFHSQAGQKEVSKQVSI